MVRIVDHSERKKQVLAAAVSAYIKTGDPVSSQELCDLFGLSSATIRNILNELERDGYLYQPHISAGRLPTDRGYRYYVDFIMRQMEISDEKKVNIKTKYVGKYSKGLVSFEDILEKTSEVIAELTHYTSIVSFSPWSDKIFYTGLSNIIQDPEIRDSKKLFFIIKLLEEKRKLLDLLNQNFEETNANGLKVYIGKELDCPFVDETCSLIVTSFGKGKKESGKIAVLGPRRMSYDDIVATLNYVSQTLDNFLNE